MAQNPRKGRKATDESQEDTVSDTTTDEAPAAEAEAPKVTPEQHEQNLYDAIVKFASDSEVPALQDAYRAIPSAARGRVQGVAMKRAMTEGDVDMDVLGSVLDAFNNLPAATKTRSSKPQVDEPTLAAIRLAGALVGYATLRESLGDAGEAADEQAKQWYQAGAPEEHQTAILRIASGIVKEASKSGRGGGGTRNSFTEKVTDLLARGALAEGTVLKGAGDAEATVNADGSITTKGEVFKNLTAAAKVHRTKDDGSSTSTNGWDFWTLDGKPVGDLRKS